MMCLHVFIAPALPVIPGPVFHEGPALCAPVIYLEFFARDRPARRAQRLSGRRLLFEAFGDNTPLAIRCW